MKKPKLATKNVILVVVLLMITSWSLIYFSFLQVKEPVQEAFTIYIHGSVQPTKEILNNSLTNKNFFLQNRPAFIFVFKDYYNLDRIYESEQLTEPSRIIWKNDTNDTHGTFSISFKLEKPVRAIITYSSTSCTKIPMDLNSTVTDLEQDIFWNFQTCGEESKIFENNIEEIQFLERYIASNIIPSGLEQLNKSQISDYYQDLGRAAEKLVFDAKMESNVSKSYLLSLQSHFNVERARFKLSYYSLLSCNKQFEELLPIFSNNSCYRIDTKTLDILRSSNQTAESYYTYLSNDIIDYFNTDNIKMEIKAMENVNGVISKAEFNCFDGLGELKDFIELQKPYCSSQEGKKQFIDLSSLIFIPLAGLVVGFILEKRTTISKYFRLLSERIKLPKEKITKPQIVILWGIVIFLLNLFVSMSIPQFFSLISLGLTTVAEIGLGIKLYEVIKKQSKVKISV